MNKLLFLTIILYLGFIFYLSSCAEENKTAKKKSYIPNDSCILVSQENVEWDDSSHGTFIYQCIGKSSNGADITCYYYETKIFKQRFMECEV